MNLIPLTAEALFSLYGGYNRALMPAAFFGLALCAFGIVLAARPFAGSDRLLSAILAGFWLWNGAVFHFGSLAPLTWAAWIFGAVFLLQGLMLLWAGAVRGRIAYTTSADLPGLAAAILLGLAIFYPALDMLAGRAWPGLQFTGTLPAPTVLATLGFLLMAQRRIIALAVIPLLWALLHGATAFSLGIWQDMAMALAACGGFLLLLVRPMPRG
jgi:hypothetical protein